MGLNSSAVFFYGIPISDDYPFPSELQDSVQNIKNGIYIGTYGMIGSNGYYRHFIAIGDTVVESNFDPEKITKIEVKSDWDSKLENFCQEYNLIPVGKAGFYICSYE